MTGATFSAPQSKLLRQLAGLTVLSAALAAGLAAVYWLRHEGDLNAVQWRAMLAAIAWVVPLKVALLSAFRVHRGWSRFVGFHDLARLVEAQTTCTAVVFALGWFAPERFRLPPSILVLDWGATLLVVAALRAVVRLTREHPLFHRRTDRRRRAVIVGANEVGETLLCAVRRSTGPKYRILAFVEDDPSRIGSRIDGLPVLGTLDALPKIVARLWIDEILVTSGEVSGRRVRELMRAGEKLGAPVRMLPSYDQILSGQVAVRVRDVSIEDLLRREAVELDQQGIRQWLTGRTVLVSGSSGSIGSELCRQLLAFNPAKLVLVDRSENGQFFLERELASRAGACELIVSIADIGDESSLRRLFDRHRPEVVFHTAAYKHVPLMESHPSEAIVNNVHGTRLIADLSHEYHVQSFVMASTDKAVNPTNVMGACKRVGEMYIQALSSVSPTRFVTVRFGNVLDSAGSVVPIFREQIARGGPITVTHPDMERFFMTIPEAAQLVVQAGAMGRGGEIFVLEMGEPVKIVDLARDMVRLSGLHVGDDVEIVFTGLRPGEKMSEELRGEGEEHVPTTHSKINVAKHVDRDYEEVSDAIAGLVALAGGSRDVIVAGLQRVVPEYRPASPPSSPLKLFSPVGNDEGPSRRFEDQAKKAA